MTLIHTRASDDEPLPCVTCGHPVPDPGAGLLVFCRACTTGLRKALRRGGDVVKPVAGRSRINRSPSNATGPDTPRGRVRVAGRGAGDGL